MVTWPGGVVCVEDVNWGDWVMVDSVNPVIDDWADCCAIIVSLCVVAVDPGELT